VSWPLLALIARLRNPGTQAAAADPTGIACQSQQYSTPRVLKKTRTASTTRFLSQTEGIRSRRPGFDSAAATL
jgi:hypothetical protein